METVRTSVNIITLYPRVKEEDGKKKKQRTQFNCVMFLCCLYDLHTSRSILKSSRASDTKLLAVQISSSGWCKTRNTFKSVAVWMSRGKKASLSGKYTTWAWFYASFFPSTCHHIYTTCFNVVFARNIIFHSLSHRSDPLSPCSFSIKYM